MKFGCLFAVKDIKAARAFYEDLFGLTVTDDFGLNIAFDCGLSLQQDFDWLTGIPKSEIKDKENNCELYFEAEIFDEFVNRLKSKNNINFLHDVVEYPWGQRVIRFYDLDNHLIEVGESMKSVVENFLAQGMTIAEIAEKMGADESSVRRMIKG
jgi:hypothetical protein